jgi:hypothetical protein
MMYYGGAMMWGVILAGLVLVGLFAAVFVALLFAGLAWWQRQGRDSAQAKAETVPVEEPRSLTHR